MRRRFVAALALGLLALAGGCNRRATAEECARMLDKYIEMQGNADPAMRDLSPARQELLRAEKKAQKRSEPIYRVRFEQCQREVTRSQYECAMATMNPDTWEACLD
jgi:hypothetical protein